MLKPMSDAERAGEEAFKQEKIQEWRRIKMLERNSYVLSEHIRELMVERIQVEKAIKEVRKTPPPVFPQLSSKGFNALGTLSRCEAIKIERLSLLVSNSSSDKDDKRTIMNLLKTELFFFVSLHSDDIVSLNAYGKERINELDGFLKREFNLISRRALIALNKIKEEQQSKKKKAVVLA